MSEQELIAACIKRKSWAMRQLYEQYAPAMLGLCVRYVSDRETGKDVMQEGFIRVFTHIGSYKGSGPFGGWMRRIFVTTALEHLRCNLHPGGLISLDDYREEGAEAESGIIEQLSAEEILRHISGLPGNLRLVFNLYAIEGYSHAEIAGLLGIQEASSRSCLTRARRILQEKLQNRDE